ncbi:MAG: M20 family metallopeptidase [Cyclobacteriaceae bacterium]
MVRLERELILNYLWENYNDLLSSLQELVLAESPSTNSHSQRKILRMLSNYLNRLDYKTTLVPGKKTGGYLYARRQRRQRNQPVQLLVGHCDTVWPLDTLREMPVQIEKNKMSGPGIYDMKAGLIQMLYALQTLNQLKIEYPVSPVIVINSDEEIGSKESKTMIERVARIADRALIMEPSLGLDGKLKTARKGVGRFTIVIRGKAAHAGLDPGKGASAIAELSHIIQKLFAMNDPEKGISVNVGFIEGGIRPNVVAPESKAVIDVRVPTHADAQLIERQIKMLKPNDPEVTLEVEGKFGRPPMEPTEANRKLWSLAQKAGNQLGIPVEEAMAGGGSDGNTTSQYTATLDGLGAVGDGAHAQHEFVFTDRLLERTALLTYLIAADPVKPKS